MITKVEVVDGKRKLRIASNFFRDEVVFFAKITSHQNKVYILEVTDKEGTSLGCVFNVSDMAVDKVDPAEKDGVYRFTMVTNNKLGLKELQEKYPEIAPHLKAETVKFDMPRLADDVFSLLKASLEQYHKDPSEAKPYTHLSYNMAAECVAQLLGEEMTIMALTSPAIMIFVVCWLHGYLTSSAVRKQNVKVDTELIPMTDEELAEHKARVEEMIGKLKKRLDDTLDHPEGEDPDDGENS